MRMLGTEKLLRSNKQTTTLDMQDEFWRKKRKLVLNDNGVGIESGNGLKSDMSCDRDVGMKVVLMYSAGRNSTGGGYAKRKECRMRDLLCLLFLVRSVYTGPAVYFFLQTELQRAANTYAQVMIGIEE